MPAYQTNDGQLQRWTIAAHSAPWRQDARQPRLLTDVLKQRLAFDGPHRQRLGHMVRSLAARNDDCRVPPCWPAPTSSWCPRLRWKRFIDNTLRAVQSDEPHRRRRAPGSCASQLRASLADGRQVRGPRQLSHRRRPLARRAVRESLVCCSAQARAAAPATASSRRSSWALRQHPGNQTNWLRPLPAEHRQRTPTPAATSLLAALRQRLGSSNVVFDADGSREDPAKFSAVVAVLAEKPYAEMAGDIGLTSSLKHSRRYPSSSPPCSAWPGAARRW